jgi:hypothetical protein
VRRGAGATARTLIRSTVADVRFVVDQMIAAFESELAALEDPESAAQVLAGLEAARQSAEQLRSQSRSEQQTLNDGIQDLTSDLDYDLRRRFRAIVVETDATLDEHDPADMWDEFEPWLHRRLGYDISAHYQLIAHRSNELAAVVAEHFADAEQALGASLDLAIPSIAARVLREDVELQRAGLSNSALAAMRGSYGGLLMFGMMGQMAGFALLNPVSLLVGIGLGRRGLREEKRRQLTQRQQQAKMTTRKYLDDVSIEAGEDLARHHPPGPSGPPRRVRHACRTAPGHDPGVDARGGCGHEAGGDRAPAARGRRARRARPLARAPGARRSDCERRGGAAVTATTVPGGRPR